MDTRVRYCIGPRIRIGDMAISAMTRQAIRCFSRWPGAGVMGEKRTVAIIVETPAGSNILDIDGNDYPLRKAVRLCPEITDLLDPGRVSGAAD